MLSSFNEIWDYIFTGGSDITVSLVSAVITIFISIALGALISVTYMKTAEKSSYSQSFSFTLIIIPTVVAIIILFIGNNGARALSLAGAFSLVRFRSTPGSSKSISYIFFAMAAGLVCGAEAYGFAVLFTVVLCGIMVVLDKINFGNVKNEESILKILIPENLDYKGVFDPVLNKYVKKYKLEKVRLTDLGSIYELVYVITSDENLNQKKLLDELRCRNGNLNISLILAPEKEEF